MARVFSLKSTPQHMWVYIVWVETGCIGYDKLAKQNVLRVSRRKTLPVRHSRKLVITICHESSHSNHVQSTCFTLRKASRELPTSNHASQYLSYITLTIKSHIKYSVQKIEHDYNRIWYGIKTNTK